MDMNEFAAANRKRCEAADGFNHPMEGDKAWTLADWYMATGGEFGEAGNIGKKLKRLADGIGGQQAPEELSESYLREKLEAEIADTFCYLDLLAQSQGINLADAVRRTWNKKSQAIGYPGRI